MRATNNATRKTRRRAGITLIEMLVVVTIIALFAAVVAPRMLRRTDMARATAARTQINSFMTALGAYKLDTGTFPSTEMGLQALEVADFAADGRDALFHERGDLLARLGLPVERVEARSDELEREALALGGDDQLQPLEVVRCVLAVPALPRLRLRHQPLPLVKADGANADPRPLRQLPDLHRPTVCSVNLG